MWMMSPKEFVRKLELISHREIHSYGDGSGLIECFELMDSLSGLNRLWIRIHVYVYYRPSYWIFDMYKNLGPVFRELLKEGREEQERELEASRQHL